MENALSIVFIFAVIPAVLYFSLWYSLRLPPSFTLPHTAILLALSPYTLTFLRRGAKLPKAFLVKFMLDGVIEYKVQLTTLQLKREEWEARSETYDEYENQIIQALFEKDDFISAREFLRFDQWKPLFYRHCPLEASLLQEAGYLKDKRNGKFRTSRVLLFIYFAFIATTFALYYPDFGTAFGVTAFFTAGMLITLIPAFITSNEKDGKEPELIREMREIYPLEESQSGHEAACMYALYPLSEFKFVFPFPTSRIKFILSHSPDRPSKTNSSSSWAEVSDYI